jgi:hypothetical protein
MTRSVTRERVREKGFSTERRGKNQFQSMKTKRKFQTSKNSTVFDEKDTIDQYVLNQLELVKKGLQKTEVVSKVRQIAE